MKSMIQLYAIQNRGDPMFDEYGNEITWFPKLENCSEPIYMTIVNALEEDINKGILKPGFKLPPQRVLANYLGINHSTVTRAFKICELKGLIRGTVGNGTFIASDVGIPQNLLSKNYGFKTIEMGMVLPLYETNSLIEEIVKEIYSKIDYSSILRYAPPEGLLKHRYIAAKWLKNFSIECDPEQVLITSGTQNALAVILAMLFKKNDKIIVDEFTYTGFKTLAKIFDISLIPVKMNENGINVNDLKSICKKTSARGIYLMPDCHNPTSICLSEQLRIKIAEIIEKNNLLLIEDSPYKFTVEKNYKPISSYVPEQSIFIAGTTKCISASFRVSYMKSPKKYVERLSNGINNLNWMTSPLNAEIVSQIIQSTWYDDIITNKIIKIKGRNIIVDKILGDFDLIKNDTSFFRYLKLPYNKSGKDIEIQCQEKGVQVFCAERFSVSSHLDKSALRLSVSGPETIEDLKKGLYIIRDILNSDNDALQPII